MKNKILIYFLSLAVLLPSTVFAQSLLDRYAPGTSYNPIEMQIIQDPYEVQRQENLLLESQLKARYGYSLYNSCMPSSCTTADSLRDPYAKSSCLRAIEYCAQSYQTRNNYATNWDSDCKNKYGAYAKLDSVNEQTSTYSCGCVSGFEFNSSGTACVPTMTSDQRCKADFPYSQWSGEYNSQGRIICSCPSGYQWNSDQTQCVRKEEAVPVALSDFDSQCRTSSGDGSRWSGKVMDSGLSANGWPICECKEGYKWNSAATKCEQMPAPSGGGGGGGGYTPPVPPVPSVISTFTYNAELAHDIGKKEMITSGSATLRSCPARTCGQKGVYLNGTIFTVRQKYGEGDLWYRGTTPDGNDGWMYSELLTEHKVVVTENNVISGSATNTTLTPEPVQALTENQEPVVPKKSTWKKIIGWFAFWR